MRHVRIIIGTVNHEYRFSINANISLILESWQQGLEMHPDIHISWIFLFHQSLFLNGAVQIPELGMPGLIGPAETEREIRFAADEHFIERTLELLFAITEPVMIVAEALKPSLSRQRRLLLPHLRQAQIVITQIGRNFRLVMSREKRLRLTDIRPFCEAFSPPQIVVRSRVVLGQIKRNSTNLLTIHRLHFDHFQ